MSAPNVVSEQVIVFPILLAIKFEKPITPLFIEEFEIKGTPATLGDKPYNLLNVFNEKLGKYGINYGDPPVIGTGAVPIA